jgi:hypothetical protein
MVIFFDGTDSTSCARDGCAKIGDAVSGTGSFNAQTGHTQTAENAIVHVTTKSFKPTNPNIM